MAKAKTKAKCKCKCDCHKVDHYQSGCLFVRFEAGLIGADGKTLRAVRVRKLVMNRNQPYVAVRKIMEMIIEHNLGIYESESAAAADIKSLQDYFASIKRSNGR